MASGYFFRTRGGVFGIVESNGRWLAAFEAESLGSYHSPEAALGDLVGGHVFWPSNNRKAFETSLAELPASLSSWERVTTP